VSCTRVDLFKFNSRPIVALHAVCPKRFVSCYGIHNSLSAKYSLTKSIHFTKCV